MEFEVKEYRLVCDSHVDDSGAETARLEEFEIPS
jgi:hypothetical protein